MGRRILFHTLAMGLLVLLIPIDVEASTIREILSEHGFTGTLDGIATRLNLDLDAPGAEVEPDMRNPGELVILCKDRVRVRIDIQSRRCVGYLREHVIKDAQSGVAGTESIDESQAIRLVFDFLAEAGIEYAPDSVRTTYSNPNKSNLGNFQFAHYTVRARRTYQGYPAQSGVTVVVDAQGGAIRRFRDLPLVPPTSMVQNVPEDEALRIARAEMESRRVSIIGIPTASLELVYPNNIWEIEKYRDYRREAEMKLCWVVRILFSKRPTGPPMHIYIDVSNGVIVGGMS